MPTRYQQLRQAIANLAAPAHEQDAYLVSILGHLAPNGGRGYGNDELSLELENWFGACPHMLEWDEVSQAQIDAIIPLDAFLEKWSGEANADFWVRDALWTDPRWEEARILARRALSLFPDEERPGWVPDGPHSPGGPAPSRSHDPLVRLLPFVVLLHLGSCAADLTTEQYSLLPLFCSITDSGPLQLLVIAIPVTALASLPAAVIAGACRQTRFARPAILAYLALLALLVLELVTYAANAGSYGCDGP